MILVFDSNCATIFGGKKNKPATLEAFALNLERIAWPNSVGDKQLIVSTYRLASSACQDIVIGAVALDFDSRVGQFGHATVATILRSCVAQTLTSGDGPRHLLYA